MLSCVIFLVCIACLCVICPQLKDYYTFEDLPVDLTPWSKLYRDVSSQHPVNLSHGSQLLLLHSSRTPLSSIA
jgi:hypothetical protein